ncbi:flagellar basal body L-ring protein FlgH [Leptospira noguchii]|uniref:flagellar basal body L-ring protein FlgH n=1 Tax=Leptospira noguchii TaxID=28182 RepID=UPI001F06C623|nr:flagellar basal body L-ring protein FlgH [Leptospira noguchii]MCH1912012.1 flagellar basal body L-ring protein FlgH [Leptospira noguchii]MCH1917505.1 flagellar basal body L-ring protein FlgH [Leptospira noguchii]UOG63142.1 flagellar basal body L-ring protein FlgH [Leptospira noguchii]
MKFDFIYKRNVDPTFRILYTDLFDSFFLNLNFINRLIGRKYFSFLSLCLKSTCQKLRVFLGDWSTNHRLTNLVSIFKFQNKSLIYDSVSLKDQLEKLNIIDIKTYNTCFILFLQTLAKVLRLRVGSLVCFFLLGSNFYLTAQDSSLWMDKNPYSVRQSMKVGSTLYVKIRNGLQAEFELESNADETLTLKAMPDKKIIPDMPSYNNDRTITRKNKGKIKSIGKIKGNLTVLVTAIDSNTGLLTIQGQKVNVINGEENSLLLSGTVSPEFVEKDLSIDSDKIANLQLNFNGKIKPQQVSPPISIKTITNPDGSVTTKAELSEEEKQKLILNQLNRLLGESQ